MLCVLSIETLSCLNVATELRMKWCEPMENLHFGNGISVSAIMKKSKNGRHFINMHCMESFQITNTPPKVSVSGFLSDNGNRISVLVIMKKLKNGCHFINMHSTENFLKITDHPLPSPLHPEKFRSLVFRVSTEMEF